MTSAFCAALDESSRAGNRGLCGKYLLGARIKTGRSEAEFSQRLAAGPCTNKGGRNQSASNRQG